MRRALEAIESEGPALLESELLGTLMLVPYLRLDCQTLRPRDFSSPQRGAAFAAIMLVKHPELGLVVDHLEKLGAAPPPNRTGWGDALSRCMDVAFVEDDAVPEAVKAIKEAAAMRKLDALAGRADGW